MHAQTVLQNKKPNSKVRFTDYSGQPYYFNDNQKASIKLKNLDEPFDVEVANVNVLSNSVEVFEGEDYIEIGLKSLDYVEFHHEYGPVIITYEKNVVNGFRSSLFSSDDYALSELHTAKVSERNYNTPGKTITKQIILKNQEYELTVNGESHNIKISKKEISRILGKKIDPILKSTKNKLKNRWDLMELLTSL